MLSTGCANKQIVKSAAGIRRIYRFAFSIVILFSTLNSNGQTIFVADAHRDDEKRFVAGADEKLTAFLQLERVTRESFRFLNAE